MTLVDTPNQQVATHTAPQREPASFRDPSGFVFTHAGRIYRAVDARALDAFTELSDCGLLGALMAEGMLVGTRRVDEPILLAELRAFAPQAAGFLQHARVPVISYPAEWSPRMLADAALLTLDLQLRLLPRGYALKDATAYNIQFVNSRPVFIDLPSIERPARLDLWHALGQFHRMFTQPLLLHRRRGLSLRGYFLANLDGALPEQIAGAFGRLERLRPAVLFGVTLPAWLNQRSAGPPSAAQPRGRLDRFEKKRGDVRPQLWQLRRLRSRIVQLARSEQQRQGWSAYAENCNYSSAAAEAKLMTVRLLLEATRPGTVLDIGCNTGAYAQLAADLGSRVTAIDGDLACVDAVYTAAHDRQSTVLPLCIDLANPTPAIGFRNVERSAFLDRARHECVLALAVIHHLRVANNLPLPDIAVLFAELTKRDLILEFVPPTDAMFQRLTRFRTESYSDYTLDQCIAAFSRRFRLVRQVPLAETDRLLIHWRRRNV